MSEAHMMKLPTADEAVENLERAGFAIPAPGSRAEREQRVAIEMAVDPLGFASKQAEALSSIRMLAEQRLTARNHPCGQEDKLAWEAVRQILADVGVVGSVLR